MILGIFILCLLILTLIFEKSRVVFLTRNRTDWIIDAVSNGLHFIVLPLLNTLILFQLFTWLLPTYKATVDLGWGPALIAHAVIDYLWYWNHRLFHAQTPLWNLHKVHHAPTSLDPLKTPRNSVWSHFFMIYWWSIGLILFVAKDPTPFLGIAIVTSMINYWGHSDFDFPENSWANHILSKVFITPRDHHWHHSRENTYCNFGTETAIIQKPMVSKPTILF